MHSETYVNRTIYIYFPVQGSVDCTHAFYYILRGSRIRVDPLGIAQVNQGLCLTSRSRPAGLSLLLVNTSFRLLTQASSPSVVSSMRMVSQQRKKLGSSTNKMSRSDITFSACCTCSFVLLVGAVGVPDGSPVFLRSATPFPSALLSPSMTSDGREPNSKGEAATATAMQQTSTAAWCVVKGISFIGF